MGIKLSFIMIPFNSVLFVSFFVLFLFLYKQDILSFFKV